MHPLTFWCLILIGLLFILACILEMVNYGMKSYIEYKLINHIDKMIKAKEKEKS